MMNEKKYDESQQKIIDARGGFLVADAGPGTGKTHTVVGRCIEIIKDNINDANFRAAMLTFTRNAAGEMEERLLGECSSLLSQKKIDDKKYKLLTIQVRKMFIGTFDSFCLSILKNAPWEVSNFFHFKESLTTSASITENETLNRVFFSRFINEWLEEYGLDPKYKEYPAIVSGCAGDVYSLINHLMSMGIMPMEHGWFGGTPRSKTDEEGPVNEPRELRGSPAKVLENLEKWAQEFENEKKETKTDLLKKCYDSAITDGFSPLDIHDSDLRRAAYDDRDALLLTIHDIYYRFMERCVATDHLTFGLTACFAYVALYNSEELRKRIAFSHLIVDEFQDTNTLQMMISMMSLNAPNLCVVGDWRQGIYGFRYVSTDNILNFQQRLKHLADFLNDDSPEGHPRVPYDIPEDEGVAHLPLEISYRSSQTVVDAAYTTLALPASEKDRVESDLAAKLFGERITSKNDAALRDHTWVNRVTCKDKSDEAAEVARRITDFINNRTQVFDKNTGTFRDARFKDVSVLCRRTKDCRTVYRTLRRYGIPAFLQGDMEIMNTTEGKLLLAWMKYVENASDARGLVPILAFMGYSANEIHQITRSDALVPEPISAQRQKLIRKKRRVTDFVSSAFSFHGLSNDITQAICDVLSAAHDGSLMTVSEMITMIEADIENETNYSVDGHPEEDAVFIQTMHKSKGLEYAYVIIPYVDRSTFPKSSRTSGTFTYTQISGVRCNKTLVRMTNDSSELDGSWRTTIVMKSEPKDYDEERRLLFVAVSRAKQYVTMVASKGSAFFKAFTCGAEVEPLATDPTYRSTSEEDSIRPPELSYEKNNRPLALSVHDIMSHGGVERTHRERGKSHGMAYGTRVHKIAEMMVRGTNPCDQDRKDIPEIEFIAEVLKDQNDCQLHPEVRCTLKTTAYGRDVALNGEIDLLAIGKDEIRIYDWKTDVDEDYVEDYRTQLSVYANCAMKEFKDKKVSAFIVWLSSDNPHCEQIDVLSAEEISRKTEEAVAAKK